MDALDVRILRSLGLQPWAEGRLSLAERQPNAMAKRFNVRPELVRERIAKLEADGVIAGYETYPNFRLLGHQQTTFHYRLAAENMKTEAIQRAARFDGVVGVYGYLGPQLCVDICYRTESDKQRRLEILGDYIGNRDAIAWIRRNPPKATKQPDTLDWRIIQALRGNAKRELDDVATQLDTSIRTIRRRVARLKDDGIIDIIPKINPAQIKGMILAQLIIHLSPVASNTARGDVLKQLDENLLFAMTPPDQRLNAVGVLLVVPSVGALEAFRRKTEANEGVDTVWVMLPSSILADGAWIDEIIQEKLTAVTSA